MQPIFVGLDELATKLENAPNNLEIRGLVVKRLRQINSVAYTDAARIQTLMDANIKLQEQVEILTSELATCKLEIQKLEELTVVKDVKKKKIQDQISILQMELEKLNGG